MNVLRSKRSVAGLAAALVSIVGIDIVRRFAGAGVIRGTVYHRRPFRRAWFRSTCRSAGTARARTCSPGGVGPADLTSTTTSTRECHGAASGNGDGVTFSTSVTGSSKRR